MSTTTLFSANLIGPAIGGFLLAGTGIEVRSFACSTDLEMQDGRVVGCACVRPLDTSTADISFISARPESWGGGIGREVVRAAEELVRSRGATEMQLELLVPKEGVHPAKERLREWYERLGYQVVRTASFEEIATHLAADLAKPCEFLIFRKPLSEPA